MKICFLQTADTQAGALPDELVQALAERGHQVTMAMHADDLDAIVAIDDVGLFAPLPQGSPARRFLCLQEGRELPQTVGLDGLICATYAHFLELWRTAPLTGLPVRILPLPGPLAFEQLPLESDHAERAASGELLIACPAGMAELVRSACGPVRLLPMAPLEALAQAHLALVVDQSGLRHALAAGCRVIAPRRPDLAEASAGLARLADESALIQALAEEAEFWRSQPDFCAGRRADQMQRVRAAHHWEQAAADWEDFLARPRRLQVSPRPLRWCFFDLNKLEYDVASPEQMPLGGSQAALCYLSRVLAARGHAVTLANRCPRPGTKMNVRCVDFRATPDSFWQDFDLIVSLNEFEVLTQLPAGTAPRRVFWNQHNHRVDGMQRLGASLADLSTVVYVSAWQQASYQQAYGLPAGYIIPNACPPFYLPLPSSSEGFLAARPGPLTLAYTSTPNRGLFILTALFPGLRQLFPDLRLKVFSSLKVYQAPGEEEAEFLPVYDQCRELEGVEYYGSVAQTELAAVLRGVHVLAYPNVYEETSCIAAMEAMAAGCQIVTSQLGALPETTAGFAALTPFSYQTEAFGLAYFEVLRQALALWYEQPEPLARLLRDQSRYALENYSWELQASRWEELGRILTANG